MRARTTTHTTTQRGHAVERASARVREESVMARARVRALIHMQHIYTCHIYRGESEIGARTR